MTIQPSTQESKPVLGQAWDDFMRALKMQLQYLNAIEDDFDTLVELRIEAMPESLGKIGRFDRERSVNRFRSSFVAADTTRIFVL
ncbi:MAG: hypothetical protein R3F19_03690 [Verrucomicrobiales bacterium]